jgi:hypothetical protein
MQSVPVTTNVVSSNPAQVSFTIKLTATISMKYFLKVVFNTIFNNISVILWQSVLLAEETAVPGENHCPVESDMTNFIT